MTYEQLGNKVVISGLDSFNIGQTLECGQCFRFFKQSQNEDEVLYTIIAFGRVLNIRQTKDIIELYPTTVSEVEETWLDYFDLNRDYNAIKKALSENDPIMKEAINFAEGIRILSQQPWECLVSFIISQNNRIPMIKQVITNLSENYGTKLDNFYSFPTINQLSGVDIEKLMLCKTGFRAKYIYDAVCKISGGQIDLNNLSGLETITLRDLLMTINGIGPKVADCILLFSMGRHEVFPTDVWVKRVMSQLYFNGNNVPLKEIQQFSAEKFKNLAGFAQQYLFHYARQMKIGAK